MKRVILLFFVLINATQAQNLKRFEFVETKMGSPFGLIFYAEDSLFADKISKKAYAIVDSLNLSFSDYLPDSEVSQLNNKTGWVPVSKDLFAILAESQVAWQKSEGAFDVTLGRLTKLWRKTKKTGILPKSAVLESAKNSAGMQYIQFDKSTQSIKIDKPRDLEIDLGGIGKGYAAQKVLEYFYSQNVKQVLVNAAGNMAIGHAPPDKLTWQIGLETPEEFPEQMLGINQMAISTSGDAYQFVTIKKQKYAHIIDPKTGLGLINKRQVTVVSSNATQADWLSTACMGLSIKKALALAEKESAEIIIFENKKNKIRSYSSKGFNKLMI